MTKPNWDRWRHLLKIHDKIGLDEAEMREYEDFRVAVPEMNTLEEEARLKKIRDEVYRVFGKPVVGPSETGARA